MEICQLCRGTGQITILSQTEIKDDWLAELRQYCLDHKDDKDTSSWIPPAYVSILIAELWQVTALSLQLDRELGKMKSEREAQYE